MKTSLKKLSLGIVMMLVLCGTVSGQIRSNSQKTEKWFGCLGLSYNTKTVNDWKTNTYYLHAFEFGPRLGTTPVFLNIGLGVDFTNSVNGKKYINSWNLHAPAYVGVLLGNTSDLHLALRGGVIYNCLLQQFVGDRETNIHSEAELQLDKRSSWFGSFRVTGGYDIYCLFFQYDIPLQKDDTGNKENNNGVWRIGICFGI